MPSATSVRHDGREELTHLGRGSAGHRVAGFVEDLFEMITHILDRQRGTMETFRPANEESRDMAGADRVDLSGNGTIPMRQEGRRIGGRRWIRRPTPSAGSP